MSPFLIPASLRYGKRSKEIIVSWIFINLFFTCARKRNKTNFSNSVNKLASHNFLVHWRRNIYKHVLFERVPNTTEKNSEVISSKLRIIQHLSNVSATFVCLTIRQLKIEFKLIYSQKGFIRRNFLKACAFNGSKNFSGPELTSAGISDQLIVNFIFDAKLHPRSVPFY
jgi:hypothetical protein